MGLWIEILKLGAEGKSKEARKLLYSDLQLTLRDFDPTSEGSRTYRGPVPKAVRSFIAGLKTDDRNLAKSYESELVDYIVDDVLGGIEQSLVLAEICEKHPEASLESLVSMFPWDSGLKRDLAWKRKQTADLLRSFYENGIALPSKIVEALGSQGTCDKFHEIAFATSPRRLELSWKDFKKKLDLDHKVVSITDSDPDDGVGSEGIDYGTVSLAASKLQWETRIDPAKLLDFHLLGRRLGPEIAAKVKAMHQQQPKHGYRTIAWHRVFWDLNSDFEPLQLDLREEKPYCETDDKLCRQIFNRYPDGDGPPSRLVALRCRQKLEGASKEIIYSRFKENLGLQLRIGQPAARHAKITRPISFEDD